MSILVDEDEPLVDVDDPPFEPRNVQVRNKDVEQEFDIYDFLGRGKFGEVKRCVERTTGKEFAAKFINAPRPQDKKEVEQEVEIMKRLQHKRLLQLYDCFCSKTEMCLVLEIILGGELFDRVIDEDFILTERACVVFMRQICEGVQYMHDKNIIHLDMKPENILCLTRTGNRIKIIDFGLAREYNPKKDLRVLFGTPEFMAPEVVQYDPISFSTDMWSVGVICYVLLSGLSPFMGDNDGDTLVNVMKGEYDFNYAEFNDVSDNAKDLINKLLVMDKSKRLTATECLEHPWLRREKPRTTSSNLDLSKKRLKRFVYRRKWQKIVNAIIALKRMGVKLQDLRRREAMGTYGYRPQETIFGWDAKNGSALKNGLKTGNNLQQKPQQKSPETTRRDQNKSVNGTAKTNSNDNISTIKTDNKIKTQNEVDNETEEKVRMKNNKKQPAPVNDITLNEQEETKQPCTKVGDNKDTMKKNRKFKQHDKDNLDSEESRRTKSIRKDDKEIGVEEQDNQSVSQEEEDEQDPPWVRKGKTEPGVLRHVPLKERGDKKTSKKKSEPLWQKRKIRKKDGIHLQTLKDWREAVDDPNLINAKLRRSDLPTDEMIATIEHSAPDSPEVEAYRAISGSVGDSRINRESSRAPSRTSSPVQQIAPEAAPASMRVVKKSRQIEIDENGRPKSGAYDVNVTLNIGAPQPETANVDTKGEMSSSSPSKDETSKKSETKKKKKKKEDVQVEKENEAEEVSTVATLILCTPPTPDTDQDSKKYWRKSRTEETTKAEVTKSDSDKQQKDKAKGQATARETKEPKERTQNTNKNEGFTEESSVNNPSKSNACEGGKIKSKINDTKSSNKPISKFKKDEEKQRKHNVEQTDKSDKGKQILLLDDGKQERTVKSKSKKSSDTKSKVSDKKTDKKKADGKVTSPKTVDLDSTQKNGESKPKMKEEKFNGFGEAKGAKFSLRPEPMFPWQTRGIRKLSLPPENDLSGRRESGGNGKIDQASRGERPFSAMVMQKNPWCMGGLTTTKQQSNTNNYQSLPRIKSKDHKKTVLDQPVIQENEEVTTSQKQGKDQGQKAKVKSQGSKFKSIEDVSQQKDRDIGIYATLPKKHRPKIIPRTSSTNSEGDKTEHLMNSERDSVRRERNGGGTGDDGEEVQAQFKIPSIRERIKRLTSINETCEKTPVPKVKFIYDPDYCIE